MIYDFTSVKVEDLEGKGGTFDMAKQLGNFIYKETGDLGMLEVAQRIFKEGKTTLEDQEKDQLINLIKSPVCPFIAIVKKEIIGKLKAEEPKAKALPKRPEPAKKPEPAKVK